MLFYVIQCIFVLISWSTLSSRLPYEMCYINKFDLTWSTCSNVLLCCYSIQATEAEATEREDYGGPAEPAGFLDPDI